MHFVFVATNKNKKRYSQDPSFVYRCQNSAKGLQKQGHTTELIHLKDLHSFKRGDVFVFHRPSFSVRLWILVKLLSLRECFVMMDVDDLIFDVDYASESPAYINNILPLKKVKKQFQRNLKAFKLFSYFSVSTPPLQEHIKQLIPHVIDTIVLPNAVFESWKELSPSATNQTSAKIDTQKIISYFPGTRSHDRDFATIQKPLEDFLKHHPDTILKITGELNFQLDIPKDQIHYQPRVPFAVHWKNYERVWVNLAPLEPTHFNHCKSALKVIEAGYFNIPTITINNSDTQRFQKAGALIATDHTTLYNHLIALRDSITYHQIIHNLQEKILDQADAVEISKNLIKFVEKYIPFKAAKERRTKGIYTIETLTLFYRAFQKKRTLKTYLAYCQFCRDLGYPLSTVRYKHLKTYHYMFSPTAHLLIDEYYGKFTRNSPLLQTLFQHQATWLQTFHTFIQHKTICIVGNATTIKGQKLGKTIDTYDIVIRFNHCCDPKLCEDLGTKHTVWVSAPNIDIVVDTPWIIVTGPYVLYRNARWNRFKSIDLDHTKIIAIPLSIWRDLVKMLQAPPSAGILLIYWLYQLRGSFNHTAIVGFDMESLSTQYHHSDTNHQPSSRHNWHKEKELIKAWIDQGLQTLERERGI